MPTAAISYRYIGTYSSDSGNLWNWGGPASSVAFDAPGTSTPWGSSFGVSAFDMGASFGTGSTDVLNTTSIYGSDELDLTSLMAANPSGYSVTDAPVFNWNGNPATPGFGCDTFSISSSVNPSGAANLIYSDTLSASDWGLVRDYETSIDTSAYTNGVSVGVNGFQNTNVQITGGSAGVWVQNVQSGTFDFSGASGGELILNTASNAEQGSTQTYAVEAPNSGMDVSVYGGSQSTDYAGTALATDGSTSLLDFYDNDGGNTVDLTGSQISSNLFLNGGFDQLTPPTMSMLFTSGNDAAGIPTGSAGFDDVVNLNPTGTGAANITASPLGLTIINGFDVGPDTLTIVFPSGTPAFNDVTFGVGNGTIAADNGLSIMDSAGTHGVVITGMFPESLYTHITSSTHDGSTTLVIH